MNNFEQHKIVEMKTKLRSLPDSLWTPTKPGDHIAGKFIRFEPAEPPYENMNLIVIQDENGQLIKIWETPWLKQKIDNKQFNYLGLKYLGKKKNPLGYKYDAFEAIIE